MPLTGGYRRTPVLQVGADIYCDTQLIMLEIEKRAPRTPLLPPGQAGEARALAMWVDRNIFWSAVGVVMGAIGDKLPEAFIKDRSDFSGRPFDVARLKAAAPFARRTDLCPAGRSPRTMLADGRPSSCWAPRPPWPTARSTIRCGSSRSGWARARPCRRSTGCREIVAWSERMKAFGSGKPTDMTGDRCARCRQGGHTSVGERRRQRSQRAESRPDDQRHAGRHRQGAGDGCSGRSPAGPRLDPAQRSPGGRRRRPLPARRLTSSPVYSDTSPFSTGTQPPPTLARMPSAARRAEQASRLGRPISTPCVMS